MTVVLLAVAALAVVVAGAALSAAQHRPVPAPLVPAAAPTTHEPEPSTPHTPTTPTSAPAPSASSAPGSFGAPGAALPPGDLDLDPDAAPVHTLDRASLMLTLAQSGARRQAVVADAATGRWIRPAGLDLTSAVGELSPDGRSVLVTGYDTWTTRAVAVLTLATGGSRTVTVPDGCVAAAAAWAPDSRHVAVDLDCEEGTRLVEVDLTTEAQRVVEAVPGGFTLEDYPSYSPDGRHYVYSVEDGREPEWGDPSDDDRWPTIRVVDFATGTALLLEGAHLTYGDPWLDRTTFLVWDEWGERREAGDNIGNVFLVDAGDGSVGSVAATVVNSVGFVGGHLLVDRSSCQMAEVDAQVCVTDVGGGEVHPWLRVRAPWDLLAVSAARDAARAD